MTDTKISALTEITDLDATDVLPVVDTSAVETKKITWANLQADVSITESQISDFGTYLANVVEDTTPQLGGNLDLNSNDITGTGNVNLTGTIDSTGAITTTATSGAAILKAESNDTIGRLHLDGSSASGDVTQIRLDLDGTAQAYIGTRTTGEFFTYVNGADALTIDTSQNITIPAGNLTAPGILVNDASSLDTDTYFQIEDAANSFAKIKSTSTGQAKLFLDSPVDPVLHLAVSGTNKWSIFSDVSETNEFNIFNNAAGNAALEIDSTSNVTIPSGDLTVSGDISGGIFTESHATSHTLTNTECFGAVYYVTGAATLTLPAVEDGMSLTVITIGAVAVSVDPNASDLIYLDGTALDDGDKITNLSTAGDIAVLTYYDATGWHASTNGWTDGGA